MFSVDVSMFLIWDRHNQFEVRSPIMFRERHEKGMYYFFKYFLKFFFKFIIWLELFLFDCVTEGWRFAKKKSYKIYRSFKRSYIDRNILYYNKNKIQIQMSVLFPNIFETKQYVAYPSNRCFADLLWLFRSFHLRRYYSNIASCDRFSYYYRFSNIATNSVNPSFIWRLEFSKND